MNGVLHHIPLCTLYNDFHQDRQTVPQGFGIHTPLKVSLSPSSFWASVWLAHDHFYRTTSWHTLTRLQSHFKTLASGQQVSVLHRLHTQSHALVVLQHQQNLLLAPHVVHLLRSALTSVIYSRSAISSPMIEFAAAVPVCELKSYVIHN